MGGWSRAPSVYLLRGVLSGAQVALGGIQALGDQRGGAVVKLEGVFTSLSRLLASQVWELVKLMS